MADLRILDRAEIAVERDRIIAQLARLDPALMTVRPEQMIAHAERGEWQLWTAGDFEAVAATSIRTMPDRSLRLWWEGCAGDDQDWRSLARQIERWGRRRGCERARLFGRKGWVRALEYEPVAVIAERVLT